MKRLISLMVTAVLCSIMIVGCRPPERRPLPQNPSPPNRLAPAPSPAPGPTPGPTADRNPSPMPTSPRELDRLAGDLATEATEVRGVKSATVVLSNTVAYVGLDLQANIEAERTNAVKREVAEKVKRSDARLTNVYVTTDADTVTRIRRVARGIREGQPIASFNRELAEIGRRVTPKTR